MFRKPIREDAYLALLEERHAEEAFAVVERERAYLREWLPWVDPARSTDDILRFIKDSLRQFADNQGFAAGIGKRANSRASWARISWTGKIERWRSATGSLRISRAAGWLLTRAAR